MKSTSTTDAIVISGLDFFYDDKKILDGVSFTVGQGEHVSVIGPNGAGKSTLLKCLNRIVRKKAGSVRLFGKELDDYTQKDLGAMIGYVAQNRDQAFPYTVFEFVQMGRYPYLNPLSRVSKKDIDVIMEALELTGLSGHADRKVAQLSGGEKQKVYIAAALAQRPKILLLDEPTTHLDPKHQTDIQKTVKDICAKLNMTILHVTHDLNHIIFWSQRILALKEGRLFCEGAPSEILNREKLNQIFDTDFVLVAHPHTNHPVILPRFSA